MNNGKFLLLCDLHPRINFPEIELSTKVIAPCMLEAISGFARIWCLIYLELPLRVVHSAQR